MQCFQLMLSAVCVSMMEAFAQICLKKGYHYIGAASYGGVAYMLARAYAVGNLSTFNTTWSAISIVNAAVIGKAVFGETLGIYNYAAMILAALAIAVSAQAP
jgi:multidrug transporter EmrE-like cation transporter